MVKNINVVEIDPQHTAAAAGKANKIADPPLYLPGLTKSRLAKRAWIFFEERSLRPGAFVLIPILLDLATLGQFGFQDVVAVSLQ